MQKWEYLHTKVVQFNYKNNTWAYDMNGTVSSGHGPVWQFINKLGEEGWELVMKLESEYELVFKRPKL